MSFNYNGGYNYLPQQNPQYGNFFNQQNVPSFTTTFVSNVAEAIATKPDVTGKPLFFYNKGEEEVYIKQYDNTGNAPIKTYKLIVENAETPSNPIIESIKNLDNKLNDIKKLLTPQIIDEAEKRAKRQNERTT